MIKIITAPDPILSIPSKNVTKVNKEILDLIEEMKKSLLWAKDPEGVGLAAPQVGKSLSIFIIKPSPKSPIKVFINPKIIEEKDEAFPKSPAERDLDEAGKKRSHSTRLEGCLSLPSIWGQVKRTPMITLSYQNGKGRKHVKPFKGFISTIIQHETDHLNGIIFTAKVLEQKGQLYKSHKDKKGQDVFEELEL